jgi:hypothetical protein
MIDVLAHALFVGTDGNNVAKGVVDGESMDLEGRMDLPAGIIFLSILGAFGIHGICFYRRLTSRFRCVALRFRPGARVDYLPFGMYLPLEIRSDPGLLRLCKAYARSVRRMQARVFAAILLWLFFGGWLLALLMPLERS